MNFDPNEHTISTFSSGKSMADIFHDAADFHLSRYEYGYGYTSNSETSNYSCIAVLISVVGTSYAVNYDTWKRRNPEFRKCYKFLKELGLPKSRVNDAPWEFYISNTPQQDRYTWLKTCAMIAEEEGL